MAGRTNEQLINFNVATDYKEKSEEELNMAQYFDPGEWDKNSPFEKRRLTNVARNFFFMFYMGWVKEEQKPSFMKTKRQRAAASRWAAKQEEQERDPDKEWKPRKPRAKKPYDPFLGSGDARPAPSSRPAPRTPNETSPNRVRPSRIMKARIVEERGVRPRRDRAPSRRSQRTLTRVNYDIPDEDRFIWCEECGVEMLDGCETHRMEGVSDTNPTGRRTASYAERTLPKNLEVKESSIPNAGRGVFTKTDIKKNTRFGPYQGELRGEESDARDSGYAWAIYDCNDNLLHYCDARDPSKSNWMRYVNCANSERDQNLTAFQYREHIFYTASQDINAGSELLTYYGDEYAADLGLLREDNIKCGVADDDDDDDIIPVEDDDDDDDDDEGGSDYVMSEEEAVSIYSDDDDDDGDDDDDDDEDLLNLRACSSKQSPGLKKPALISDIMSTNGHPIIRGRQYIPLSGNTKEMNELPDLRQYYNKETMKYSCPCCVYKLNDYASVNFLLGHVKNEHTSLNPNVFRNLLSALYKMNVSNATDRFGLSVDEIERKVYSGSDDRTCGICNKLLISRHYLAKHVLVHTGEKPFTCDICNHGFIHRGHLKTHLRVHTGEKPFTCDICNHGFSKSSDLKRHMRVHTGEKPFTCDICNHGFNRRSSLKTHMRVHTGEKPFTCGICNHGFIHRGHLKTHMRVHTGEKPFTCDICNHGFNQRGSLKKHMRVHTGEKPFTCDYCDKTFSRSSDRNKHMKTTH